MDVIQESQWIHEHTLLRKTVTFFELNRMRNLEGYPYYTAQEKLQLVSYLERNCGVSKTYTTNPSSNQTELVLILPEVWKSGKPDEEEQRYHFSPLGSQLY